MGPNEAYDLAEEWREYQIEEDHVQTFMGIGMAQSWPDLLIWEAFFNNYPVKTFVELGTGHGGLATFFALQCAQRGIQYHTFDNVTSTDFNMPIPAILGMAGNYHNVDIFHDGYDLLISILQTSPRPLALFCDDGDKPREWRTFVPHLVAGDYCAVHDWGTEFKQEHLSGQPVERILTNLSDTRPPGWKAMWFRRI